MMTKIQKIERLLDDCINNVDYQENGLPSSKSLLNFFDSICGLVGYVNGEKVQTLDDVIDKYWSEN